jgi:hypothetical protein
VSHQIQRPMGGQMPGTWASWFNGLQSTCMPALEISFYSAYRILLLCWQPKKCLGSISTSALATVCGTPGTLNAKHSQLLESPYTSHIIPFFQKYSLMSLKNSSWSFRFSLEKLYSVVFVFSLLVWICFLLDMNSSE